MCGELRHIQVILIQIRGVGHAEGNEGAVGTHVVRVTGSAGVDQSVVGAVVSQNLSRCRGDELQAALTGCCITLVDTDVGLLASFIIEVPVVTAGGLLYEDLNSLKGGLGGCQTVGNVRALGLAVEVQGLLSLVLFMNSL